MILYRMLTGRLPFEGASALEVALKHRTDPPPPVQSFRPDAPAGLALLAEAALAKDPSARPQTGVELAAALAGGGVIAPTADSTLETVVLRPRRARPSTRVVAAGLGAFGVFVAGGLAAVFVNSSHGTKQSPIVPSSGGSGKRPAVATAASQSGSTRTAETSTGTRPDTTTRSGSQRSTTSRSATTTPATTPETTEPATTETAPTTSGTASVP